MNLTPITSELGRPLRKLRIFVAENVGFGVAQVIKSNAVSGIYHLLTHQVSHQSEMTKTLFEPLYKPLLINYMDNSTAHIFDQDKLWLAEINIYDIHV